MIKKFNNFNNSGFFDNEREAMERELRFRKTKRNNTKYDLDINIQFIKEQIIMSINNDDEYFLSIGKRVEELENSKESVFHIEFENERLGRIRIFKPKDTSVKGHYEVNGEYYETSAKDIRDFYHYLNQKIKGKPIKENLTDKMTPKTDKEIAEAMDKLVDRCTNFALDYYPERFNDWTDTYDWFDEYSDRIKDEYEYSTIEDIVIGLVEGKW